MTGLGQHLVVDCWGCGVVADDAEGLRKAMAEAVAAMGATLLSLHVHTFQPRGVAAVAVLSESHLAVHTWPEHGYVAIDAFTCGASVDPEAGVAVLCQFFAPRETSTRRIARGVGQPDERPARPTTLDRCR
jgi:S-adenosylmethionine decarboxylase